MKKLSIVTITYNDLDGLKRTVPSVIKQMSEEIEYIIIDGKSIDGTDIYLSQLDSRITIVSEYDTGIYNAMNKGIKTATGEWIIFINAGDLLYDGFLDNILPELTPNRDCLYGNVYLSIEYNGSYYLKKENASPSVEIESLRKGMLFSHQAFICKRSKLCQIGGFDETFKTAADWESIVRLKLVDANFVFVDKVMAVYDKTGVSSTPHPFEKHRIRKKNKLYSTIDIFFIVDLIASLKWYIIKIIFGNAKKKYQIKCLNYKMLG